jgi:hypothetical protein
MPTPALHAEHAGQKPDPDRKQVQKLRHHAPSSQVALVDVVARRAQPGRDCALGVLGAQKVGLGLLGRLAQRPVLGALRLLGLFLLPDLGQQGVVLNDTAGAGDREAGGGVDPRVAHAQHDLEGPADQHHKDRADDHEPDRFPAGGDPGKRRRSP